VNEVKRMRKLWFVVVFVFTCLPGNIFTWGFWAHKTINYYAVFCVPEPIFFFYKKNIEIVSEWGVNADRRRYRVPDEAPKHHIDIDYYIERYFPGGVIPYKWDSFASVVPPDTYSIHGILPWAIQKTYYALVNAFKEKRVIDILKLSADLGHYVGDACVPLHTTRNYDGQFTGQHGLHSLWESRIPELFGNSYDFFVGGGFYVRDPLNLAWELIRESYAMVDSVLKVEKEIQNEVPPSAKFTYEKRGKRTYRVVSEEYAKLYHERLNGMQERRMRRAILAVASLWYSAWIDAGQPRIDNIPVEITEKDTMIAEPYNMPIDSLHAY